MGLGFHRIVQVVITLGLIVGFLGCHSSSQPKQILAIGDSNGAFEKGWVAQLQEMLPGDSIYNVSTPGNTVSFDNLNNPELNGLKNLDGQLRESLNRSGRLDYVILLLGTNDAKAIFKDSLEMVPANVRKFVSQIREYKYGKGKAPDIILVSPPPYGPDSILAEKYKGGNNRVRFLAGAYKQISEEEKLEYVNIYALLEDRIMDHSHDGVHLDEGGQRIIAKAIKKSLN